MRFCNLIIGLILGAVAIFAGIYVGLIYGLIGGIIEIVAACQADPLNGVQLAWGIARVIFVDLIGVLAFIFIGLLAGIFLRKAGC